MDRQPTKGKNNNNKKEKQDNILKKNYSVLIYIINFLQKWKKILNIKK